MEEVTLRDLRIARETVIPTNETKVTLDIKVERRHVLKKNTLAVDLRFTVTSTPATFSAEAVYALRYKFGDTEIATADADAFARHNAIFNAWPFWRQLVHDLSLKMGLSAAMMPLLRA